MFQKHIRYVEFTAGGDGIIHSSVYTVPIAADKPHQAVIPKHTFRNKKAET